MVIELAHLALCLATALLTVQAGAAWHSVDSQWLKRLAGLILTLVILSFAGLLYAFITSDFSVALVVAHSHTGKPLLYKIAGSWGNHEGSLLLWLVVMVLYNYALACSKNLPEPLRARALAYQAGLTLLFALFCLLTSNPFARDGVIPLDGRDLNPLLQDISLALHPPLLYLGYVGFSAVFALTAAALTLGIAPQQWAHHTLPIAAFSTAALTGGITLGSYWAYYELGWGGWWFWDPVENASFIPWLLGAALVHALLATKRSLSFPRLAMTLGLLCFSASVLGTFIVRSGALTSVHSFAVDPTRGLVILGILALLLILSVMLLTRPWPHQASPHPLTSREGLIAVNTLFMLVAAATVMLGTLYPLLLEGITGQTVAVGAPYYDIVFNPLALLLMLVMGLVPYAAWCLSTTYRRLSPAIYPLVASGGIVLGIIIWYGAVPIMAALGGWLIGWILLTHASRRLTASTLAQWLGHCGLAIAVAGMIISSVGKSEYIAALTTGESLSTPYYTLTLEALNTITTNHYTATQARLRLTGTDGTNVTLLPERRRYQVGQQETTEVAIQSFWWGDVYSLIGQGLITERLPIQVYLNPGMGLLWLGTALVALGFALAAWQRRR